MLSCQADGSTFALGQIQATSTARADELVKQLLPALRANISANSGERLAWSIPGTAVDASPERASWSGSLANGASIRLEAGAFSNNTSAYQVTVSGEKNDPEAVTFFFSSLKVNR
jgi:hypothetical protein